MIGRSIVAVLLLCGTAHAQSIDRLIALDAPHVAIDAMASTEREHTIAALGQQLPDNILRIGQILCAVDPWSTGFPQADDQLQAEIWDLMAEQPNAYTEEFRWLDCAAINREGYYRAAALDPMEDLNSAYCTGDVETANVLLDPALVQRRIRRFDTQVRSGLSASFDASDDTALYSYFPVRNAVRLANLEAGRAVQVWPDDPTEAQRILAEAARDLETFLANLDIEHTRNGWRMRNELAFHAALYAWLAGEGDSSALEAIGNQPPVFADPTLQAARDAGLLDHIPAEERDRYVEYIYVERLLPGALAEEPEQECNQWRRRSYSPDSLATAALACGRDDLIDFDRCMASFQASDWTIQFAIRNGLQSSQASRLSRDIDQTAQAAVKLYDGGEAFDVGEILSRLQVQPIADGTRTVFMAEGQFTTSERSVLAELFSRNPSGPVDHLFLRPRSY